MDFPVGCITTYVCLEKVQKHVRQACILIVVELILIRQAG